MWKDNSRKTKIYVESYEKTTGNKIQTEYEEASLEGKKI